MGDKILFFAGGSLVGPPSLKSRLIALLRNAHSESSYGVTPDKLDRICQWIVRNKPLFIRGYASSVAVLADHFFKRGFHNDSVRACFTTAEPLFPKQREIITTAFGRVFDGYGLLDGAVSATECEHSPGMHINSINSILEVCDDNGAPVPFGQEGRVIATDLYNSAFPFIRYDTGDRCIVDDAPCPCGNTAPRIVRITGRSADALIIDGIYTSGSALTVLMGKTLADMYMLVQTSNTDVDIHMLYTNPNQTLIEDKQQYVRDFFCEHAPAAKLAFSIYTKYSDFPVSKNKLRHIINEYSPPNIIK